MRILLLCLAAAPLALQPPAAAAQGTAPAQGVNRPIPRPAPETAPPAPRPGEITDGRPRTDTGGASARTTPDTTSGTRLPPANQADPPARR